MGFFRNAERFQIYDAFLVDKFPRACAYHKIVCVRYLVFSRAPLFNLS